MRLCLDFNQSLFKLNKESMTLEKIESPMFNFQNMIALQIGQNLFALRCGGKEWTCYSNLKDAPNIMKQQKSPALVKR